jgi:hypothetical protein
MKLFGAVCQEFSNPREVGAEADGNTPTDKI